MGLSRDIRVLPKATKVLLVLNMVNNLGTGLVMPFLVVYVSQVIGLPMTVAATAITVSAAAMLLGAPIAGAMTDRFTAEGTAVAFLTVQSAGIAGYAFAGTSWHFLISAAVIGFGAGGSAAWSTMLARSAPSDVHSVMFGVNFAGANAAVGLGGVAGALVASVGDPMTFRMLYLANAMSCLIVAVAVLFGAVGRGKSATTTADKSSAALSSRTVLRDTRLLIVLITGGLLFAATYAQFESGLPMYAVTEIHMGTQGLATLFVVNTVCVIAGQAFLGHWFARLRDVRAVSLAAALWTLSWLMIWAAAFVSGDAARYGTIIVAVAVFALAESVYAAGMPTLINRLASEEARGRYNAAYESCTAVGFMVGPVAAGQLITTGSWFMALLALVCALSTAVFVLDRLWLRRALISGPPPALVPVPEPPIVGR